jgi:hypothetical protein
MTGFGMSINKRIVLDTNILILAALDTGSIVIQDSPISLV